MREAVLAARRALTASDRAERSDRIARRVLALDAFERAGCVALYAPIGAEVETDAIARAAAENGKRTAYPRLSASDRAMTFARCAPSALVTGAYGTLEPPASAPVVDSAALDLVIVPGVAFDPLCRRVGRGRGHYDATLARLPPSTLRIGLAFELQVVDEVPSEPHDALLDAVVTEARVLFRLPPGPATGRS
jgi:5-formyltetrahydrofolate cyclo-ligase